MRKRVERLLVVVLTVVTVSTTAVSIHNFSRTGQPLGGHLSLNSGVLAHAFTQPMQGAGSIGNVTLGSGTGSKTPSGVKTTPTAKSSAGGVVTGWSQSDVQTFLAIAQKLMSSLTPADLNRITTALANGNESTAQTALMSVVNEHLSSRQENWLATHMAGDKPFGPEDVQLLQQTIKQLTAELTPSEQQLLQSYHLFGNGSSS